MKNFLLILLVVFSANTFAQVTHTILPFKELEVTDKISVRLIASDKNSLTINGPLQKEVEIIQGNDKLRIKMVAGKILKGEDIEVLLYSNHFTKISARKGAVVFSDGAKLSADSLSLIANEGSKIDLTIQANYLDVYSNSGSSIDTKGSANAQNINIFAGGVYNGLALISKNVIARVNAGGKCIVHASELADVQTRAGGSIEIHGNPKDRKQKKIAGGAINFL